MSNTVGPETQYIKRHLRVGWGTLAVFAAVGLVLETLHGFKIPQYVDLANENRRLMWTLAHSHGTLLGMLNILFALCVQLVPDFAIESRRLASMTLIAATLLLPGGFLVAGIVTFGGDPGIGIVFVPFGAMALLLSLWMLAKASGRSKTRGDSSRRA